ncbi:unnamed protein product [Oikopleura dioica]|uniref:Rap-GAP domain-containing protein n=1 Tax=Oikopleura dioica TaxID=34765 RepID=E4XLR7_OIKDI|nr:unnamed protein product [Oikopleura dioica]
MNEIEHHYDECPSEPEKKQKLGRKISRVLSIFRKEPKLSSNSKEPVYEELHEVSVQEGSEISAPQYSISTVGRLDSGISSGSDQLEPSFAEVLRNGAPFPQVVAPNGWWVRGFRHRAPTLFLSIEELKPVDIAYVETSVNIDKKTLFYREEFIGKEHLNLLEKEEYSIVLRSVSGSEIRQVAAPTDSIDWASAVFGSLSMDTFSPVVSLNAWETISSYDEHSTSKIHNVGLVLQLDKQYDSLSMVSNTQVSRHLTNFLATISTPIRGTDGSTAYHAQQGEHNLMIHPAPMMKTFRERQERALAPLVQIIFQGQQTPFSPDLMGEDQVLVYIIVQPIHFSSKNEAYKVSIVAEKSVADFGPKIPEPSVVSKKNLQQILIPLLINASNAALSSKKLVCLRARARAELFADLIESLSGWNGTGQPVEGQKISELVRPPMTREKKNLLPDNDTYMVFMKAVANECSRTRDSGCSSGNYSSNELLELPVTPPPARKPPTLPYYRSNLPVVTLIEKPDISRYSSASLPRKPSRESCCSAKSYEKVVYDIRHSQPDSGGNRRQKSRRKPSVRKNKPTRSESRRSQEPKKDDFLEKKSQYDRLKHDKIVERCRSLSDLGFKEKKKVSKKYSKLDDLDFNCTSDSSIDSLSDMDFTYALSKLNQPRLQNTATRKKRIPRAASLAVLPEQAEYPVRPIIKNDFSGRKERHSVSFRE